MQSKKPRNILFIRKYQNTIKTSLFKLSVQELEKMKIADRCKISAYNLEIELPNGSLFIFKGIDDPEKIKSIANIDDIVIEEATEITPEDFSQLNLRLRSRAKNQQIHLMFNPVSRDNWIYKEFFEQKKPNTRIIHTTYKDNHFLPKEYIESLENYKSTNPLYYSVYALGEWGVLGKKVYTNWRTENFDYQEIIRKQIELNDKADIRLGLDFGFIADPTALVAAIVDDVEKKIYIFDEVYQQGLLNSEIADIIIAKGYHKQMVIADSAEQKSIAELRQLGISGIKPAKKGAGSIISGIMQINEYELIVHDSCKHTINELKNYTYKQDKKTGEYINKPIDKYNHLLDALRYLMSGGKTVKRIKGLSKGFFGL